jgi:hypothetical protein
LPADLIALQAFSRQTLPTSIKLGRTVVDCVPLVRQNSWKVKPYGRQGRTDYPERGAHLVSCAASFRKSLAGHPPGDAHGRLECGREKPHGLRVADAATGEVDALIGELTQHYPEELRPVLQVIPGRPDLRRVCGVYVLMTPRRDIYVLADDTVNAEPSGRGSAGDRDLHPLRSPAGLVRSREWLLSPWNFGSMRHSLAEKGGMGGGADPRKAWPSDPNCLGVN